VPRSEGGKGGKGLEEDLDASKSGEAFDPRTLDLKVGDTSC
jgi:plastocyanin|tara:strand:+ start:288 stop:410 length:123 start_codon:yes stop_codon:yes gene_type:complete